MPRPLPCRFIVYPNDIRANGSAKPIEPPMPGCPNASSDSSTPSRSPTGRYRLSRAGRVGRDGGRDPRLLRSRQAEPELQPERLGHLLAEEGAERPAAHPPDDLADEEAERQPVVAVPRARAPERLLAGQRIGH